eukprot:m.1151135 g.1151135  ORF g.1151135 m.1151135 type:complete len:241 (-) comp24480_c0_seq5:220-942(-)
MPQKKIGQDDGSSDQHDSSVESIAEQALRVSPVATNSGAQNRTVSTNRHQGAENVASKKRQRKKETPRVTPGKLCFEPPPSIASETHRKFERVHITARHATKKIRANDHGVTGPKELKRTSPANTAAVSSPLSSSIVDESIVQLAGNMPTTIMCAEKRAGNQPQPTEHATPVATHVVTSRSTNEPTAMDPVEFYNRKWQVNANVECNWWREGIRTVKVRRYGVHAVLLDKLCGVTSEVYR